MTNRSLPYPPDLVRQRYNRLAPWYPAFEWILWLPRGIRARAVRKLELEPGDSVLEVGCGTGRNFQDLQAAIGPGGHLFGVDLSAGMLARAQTLCKAAGWRNVTLVCGNAVEYKPPYPLDAILFSLSYGTMQNRHRVLDHAWSQLAAGGRLVIVDGKAMPGFLGWLLHPLIVFAMKASVLGDPDHEPWADLLALANHVEIDEELLGAYFTCRARKEGPGRRARRGSRT